MSDIKIQPSATGSATVTLTAPVSNTARTITLPDSTGTILDSVSTLDATKLSGNLPALSAANLTAIPAGNLTGTLPAIDGSALTGIDLESIRRDIATLALHSAIADNKAAYNLPNSFIDQFEDGSGLGTQTDVGKNGALEYISTITNPYRYWQLYETNSGGGGGWHRAIQVYTGSTEIEITSDMFSNQGLNSWANDQFTNASTNWFHTDSASVGDYLRIDFGAGNEQAIDKWKLSLELTNIDTIWNVQYSSDASSWTNASTGWNMHGWNGWGEVTWTQQTSNATGTLISTAQTANAAQTKVSGVILYKNEDGTATLGTDLKVYFTCNGGTNWTESTPVAAGTFSTGILMAKCPEVTCTSGTDVRYKVVWANQAAGSKETQLHGIAMNY